MTNRERFSDAFAPGFCVHASTMSLGVNATNNTVLVERQPAESRQFTTYHDCLIETSCTFAIGVQRNRNDHICCIERFAPLHLVQTA